MTTTAVYKVQGMTCGHCVQAITAAFQALPGVSGVSVDLPTGQVTVHSDGALAEPAVRAAVDDAGFELATA